MFSQRPHKPEFSVLIPAYRSADCVGDAIASLKRQSWQDFEAIVWDDGSDDGTWESAMAAAGSDPRFLVRRSERNEGVGVALNHAIALARGNWIARLDADDEYADDYLEERARWIVKRPDVACFYGGMQVIGGPDVVPDATAPDRWIPISETCQGPTIVIRADLLRQMEGFPRLRYGEDYALLERVRASAVSTCRLDDGRYRYRRNRPQSLTRIAERGIRTD